MPEFTTRFETINTCSLGIIKIVNHILEVKIANPDADTTDLEKEIDKRVYALYNLTQEEMTIVEEAMQ